MRSKPDRLGFSNPLQGGIFISFFLASSKMAWAPVESMKTGGALWFPDLTVADPTYLLPVITALTLGVIIEVSIDSEYCILSN